MLESIIIIYTRNNCSDTVLSNVHSYLYYQFHIESLFFSKLYVEDLPAFQKNHWCIIHEHTNMPTKLLKEKRAVMMN